MPLTCSFFLLIQKCYLPEYNGKCLLTSTFSKLYFKVFSCPVQICCKAELKLAGFPFYFLLFPQEFRVTFLFLDLRCFYCVGLAQRTKAGSCCMFSLEHKAIISTEVFIGIGFGHDAILSKDHL